MNLTNPIQINSKSLEFEIKIKSTDTNFTLSSYQCSFSFKVNIERDDSISLSYIENSSELGNFPLNIIGFLQSDGINELVFTSGIGNDLISVDELLVGKFKINSPVDFTLESLDLKWNFEGSINTILTDANFTNITLPANHLNFNENITNLNNSVVIPSDFELSQNYPNPFNPTTKINFTLPEKGIVNLTIYNILGQKVMDVLNDSFSEGTHTIKIDGSLLSSGIYFYKIDVKNKYSAMKKMILMK